MSYYNKGMGGFWDELNTNLFGTANNSGQTGNDGEYAIPGNIPRNTSSSSGGYVYITVNNKTYSVNTPAGYSLWPEAAKQGWLASQRSILAGQGGASSGADLRSVQAALNNLPSNLPRLAVDGGWGAKTSARVAEFQRQNGFTSSGVLDPGTSAAILRASPATITPPNAANNNYSNANPFGGTPPPNTSNSSWMIYGVLALVFVFAMRD
jgi:hypothetical protein